MSEEGVTHLYKEQTSRTGDQDELSKNRKSEHPVVPKKAGDGDVQIVSNEMLVKSENGETDPSGRPFDVETPTIQNGSRVEEQGTNDDSRVGKLKVRSFASIAEPQLTRSFPQANLYDGGSQDVPQAHQRFPYNLAFPGQHKLPTAHKRRGNKEHERNDGFTDSRLYMENEGLPFLYPARGNSPNASHILAHLIPQKFSALGVPFRPGVNRFRIPTASTVVPPKSYSPLNIPSMCLQRYRPPHTSLALVSSIQNAISETMDGPLKEGIKSEGESERLATDCSGIHPLSTSTNTIVKDELDLGVSLEDHGEHNPNNFNDFGNHFIDCNLNVPPKLEKDFCAEDSKQSDPNDLNRFLTSNDISSRNKLEMRYQDVDPNDLIPPSNPDGKFQCRYCDFRYDSDDAMKKHNEGLHTEKYNYRCFLCTKPYTNEFPSRQFLEHHVATVHHGKKRFQCVKCGSSLTSWIRLKTHLAKMCNIVDPFACHLCNFMCTEMAELENHRSKHEDTMEECTVCLEKVKKSLMRQHMDRHQATFPTMSCENCDFATSNKTKMGKHYRLTNHNKKFRCQLCKFATNHEEHLKNHQSSRIHKLLVCTFPGCGKEFARMQKSMYLHHCRTHTIPETSLFHCPAKDCDYRAVLKGSLRGHIKATKHNLAYPCPECSQRFAKEETMARHIQLHIDKIMRKLGAPIEEKDLDPNNLSPFLTSDDISSNNKLEIRYQDVEPNDLIPPSNPNGKFRCRYCDFRYDSDDAIKQHNERLHSKKYNYRCFLCTRPSTYKFLSCQRLEHHVATAHHGKKRFQCSKCGSSLTTRIRLKTHLAKMCKIADPFACNLCNFTCTKMTALEKHRSKHDDTMEECTVCMKKVKALLMRTHMYSHQPKTLYKCDKCDFATSSKANMAKHYRLTSHNKKFRCQLCKFATNSEEHFKNHQSTSTHELLVCTFQGCGKEFTRKQKTSYLHHCRTHTIPETSMFHCPAKDCDYKAVPKVSLIKHMKATKHNRVHPCPECTQRFAKEETMARHIQRLHVDKIMGELGYPVTTDLDSDAVVNQIEDDADEEDPYAHFKKGWLGISCFEEEEIIASQQQSGAVNTVSDPCLTVGTDTGLLNKEFTHVVPEMSDMIECKYETNELSVPTHSNIITDDNDTDSYETMIVTPSIDLMNSAVDNGDKANKDAVYNPGISELS